MELKPHEIRFAGRPRTPRDPRQEKRMDYRRHNPRFRYDKEDKIARKMWNRLNRSRAKHAIRNARDFEELEIIDLKKTSGWWTW